MSLVSVEPWVSRQPNEYIEQTGLDCMTRSAGREPAAHVPSVARIEVGGDVSSGYEGLLNQIGQLAGDGHLGSEAKAASREYAALPNDLARCVTYINDFADAEVEEELRLIRSLLCQVVLAAYRDANKIDSVLARNFAFAFFRDFPGMSGSALLPRWSSLADASYTFQMVAHSGNRLLIWQQSSRLVLATNELLDGLIGLLIIAWRCALGRTVNPNVLGNAYGSKINEFADLTGGDDGPFYLILRTADADLRNGLAHGAAWLDPKEDKVRYITGRQKKTECEMDLIKFMSMATVGSHLGPSYIAALATVAVWESGDTRSRGELPPPLTQLLSFAPV